VYELGMSKRSLAQAADACFRDEMQLKTEALLPTLPLGVRFHLLKGHLDNLPTVQSRVMRVYISSHFDGIIITIVIMERGQTPCFGTQLSSALWQTLM